MNEYEALHSASSALARLDERLRTDRFAEVLATWTLSQETIGIAAWEGIGVREADLVAMLGGGDSIYDKSIRTAEGIHAALSVAYAWTGPTPPTSEAVVECLRRSDEMNVTRKGGADDGLVDNHAVKLTAKLDAIGSPDPWTAAANLHQILRATGDFRGRSKRVAFLVSPWLVANGFGLARASAPPMALSLYKATDFPGTQETIEDEESWTARYFSAVAAGAKRSYDALCTFERLAAEAESKMGKKRADSKFVPVLNAFLGQPIHSVVDLANRFDVSHQGATFVVKALVEAGVIASYDSSLGKGRLFVLRKGLGLTLVLGGDHPLLGTVPDPRGLLAGGAGDDEVGHLPLPSRGDRGGDGRHDRRP